jgi:hypothetical protein
MSSKKDIMNDPRFSHLVNDPRYKQIPLNQRKVKIDERFKGKISDSLRSNNFLIIFNAFQECSTMTSSR